MIWFPPWTISVVISVMLAVIAIAFAAKKKLFHSESSNKQAEPALVDDMMSSAEIDYSELQRNLNEGVNALDNVRENVQTLFSGVHGAQILHSEVENCVSALAEELDLTSSSETTVFELEKLLENETRNRWALRITHEKELKSVNEKCSALETAVISCREQFEHDLASQECAFELILREKNDEIGILETTSSEQKQKLCDLQKALEQIKIESDALKATSAECDKLAESASQSAIIQENLTRQLDEVRSELNFKTQEAAKLSSDLTSAKDSLMVSETTIEQLQSEKECLLSVSNENQEKYREYVSLTAELQTELENLKNELANKENVSADIELKLAENAMLQSQLDEAITKSHQLKIELSISSDERSKLLRQINEQTSVIDTLSPDISSLCVEKENLSNENKTLQDTLEKLRYDLKTKVDDLSHKDAALHEALSQAEQYRSEQKKLTDTQLEISAIEAQQHLREVQLKHDQDICLLKQNQMQAVDEIEMHNKNSQQSLIENHREEVAILKLEVLEANRTIDQLQENIAQLSCDLKLLQDSSASSNNKHLEHQLELEVYISNLKTEITNMECKWSTERSALEASNDDMSSQTLTLQSELKKLQQENCILSNALLEETSKQKFVLDELEESRRLSDVLKSQYESLQHEEEQQTLSRVQTALQQKSLEFEATVHDLVQNYDNQIAELNDKLATLSSLDEDAQERERAFAETLQESLAAVNRSKDSEIASIHQDYRKKLSAKDAESDAARLDFQSKLESANKSMEQQAKSFEERLKAELDAQNSCSSKRLEFAENTISKLQDELQTCRTVINDLNAEVKLSKFKADGAGVLLDRVHSYKTQLACSDQEKSELLQILDNRDKDLQRLNAKVRELEIMIAHFENAIQEYEIEFKNHVETINLLHTTYTSKMLNLEHCIDHLEEQRLNCSSNTEQNLRKEIGQLKLSIEHHQADLTSSLETFEAFQQTSSNKISEIEDSFKKEKDRIIASKDELEGALVEKVANLNELQSALDSKHHEITELKSTFEGQISQLQCQFALERQHNAEQHNEALESLKRQHEEKIEKIQVANQIERLVMFEKAKSESAKEWQSLLDTTQAAWKDKLRMAVETQQSENAAAIKNAVECGRQALEERHQADLKEQQETSDKQLADVNAAWQCKLDETTRAIEFLQVKLDQLDRFHKPKSRAPLGEHDPLTGSRPGSTSGSNCKKSKTESKENAPTNEKTNRSGPGSESSKTVSSRGSRSRSRRDSFGYRYWKASDFHLQSELGLGTYGTHYLAIEHKTSNQYVINRISRRKIEKTNSAETLIQRIEIMGQLTHPYLRRMLGSFEDDRWIYIVQEYISNSKPLSMHLQDLLQKKYVFPPSDVAFLVSCLANVLDYIHNKGVVHCQVAINKVLLTSNGVPKLSGPTVGLSNLPVLPPEYLSGNSAPSLSWAVDSWSLGVLSFTLLVGRVPFAVEDNVVDVKKVAKEQPIFSSHSDPLAKSLIENLLCKDPLQRLSMNQVLQHPFILHYQKKDPLTTIREDRRLQDGS